MFHLIEVPKFPNTSNLFYINWKGELFTKNFLDYETSKNYRFQIGLLSNCNSSSKNVLAKANVIVQIADVNDNSPIFENKQETPLIQIYENMQAGTVLYRFD